MGGIRLGVLDLYRDEAGDLSDTELCEALSFADAATSVLRHLQAQHSANEPGGPDDLDQGAIEVVEDRAEVLQASGMISVQAGVDVSEALVLLRARAYATDRPILDLAADVLDRTVDFGGGTDEDEH